MRMAGVKEDHLENALIAADEIYNVALQILNQRGVDAAAVPLIVATAMQRLEAFAIGAMAREVAALKSEEDKEVEDGGHIGRD